MEKEKKKARPILTLAIYFKRAKNLVLGFQPIVKTTILDVKRIKA